MPGDRTGPGLPAPRRTGGDPRRRGGRVPRRVRAASGRGDRHRPGRTSHRLRRLLPERLRAGDAGTAVHPSERRCGGPGVARLRGVRPRTSRRRRRRLRPPGHHTGHPAPRRHPRDGGRGPGVDRGGARPRCRAHGTPGAVRPGGRHHLRWLGRHERHHRQPRRREGGRPARRRRRDGRLRGDGRAHRLRAPHGAAGRHPRARGRDRREGGQGGRLLHGDGARQLRTGQRRRWPHHAGGEVARRLLEVGQRSDPRRRDTGAARADPRAVPARRRPRGHPALGLPQHQRQRRDRRADRLRRAPRAVHHRPGLGRRVRDLAGDQGLRQSRDLPAHGRRHGRRRRAHPGGARRASTTWPTSCSTWCSPTAAGAPTASEDLGHQEFVLTYKSSEPTGPACLPMAR